MWNWLKKIVADRLPLAAVQVHLRPSTREAILLMRTRFIPIVHPTVMHCPPERYPEAVYEMAQMLNGKNLTIEYINCETEGCADWDWG